ncbi:MAG TPA: dihydrolipoamide acetyltransferase family protein [Longimicrobiales bacterium]|nr:dihydrolipoamide acetyltransferase family protein [Longimicrobiales bacterium]
MARIEVPMPQMGESIAEGTVSKWLKKVGDQVGRDEPLLEISTDKVDAEIPSPAAGTLAEIVVNESETVEVGTVVAFIETEAGAAAASGGDAQPASAAADDRTAAQGRAPAGKAAAESKAAAGKAAPAAAAAPAAPAVTEAAAPAKPQPAAPADGREESAEERLRRKSTPLVRRIAAEHGVDIGAVEGSGHAGRVTKQDIMSFIEKGGKPAVQPAAAPQKQPAQRPAAAGASVTADAFWDVFHGQVKHPEFPVRENDDVEPMDRIRRLTADHMVRAKRIAAHVHSFIEIDFTQIDRVRAASRKKWEQAAVKVSYTGFVAWAIARVLPEFPMVNSTVSGDNIIYRGDINVGIAVDLNPGLIVPVIKNADELNLVGISKRIIDLAERARNRKLKPDEIQGATFSITNPGVLGTMVGMPVIPEGTAAILGTGAIEKRAVVIEADGSDVIAIRKRSFFSLGYDHRIVDGADAARFLARLKQVLETFPEDA